jgi:hypothetical protein
VALMAAGASNARADATRSPMTKEGLTTTLAHALKSNDEFPDGHPLIEYERPVVASAGPGSPLLIALQIGGFAQRHGTVNCRTTSSQRRHLS